MVYFDMISSYAIGVLIVQFMEKVSEALQEKISVEFQGVLGAC